MIGILYSRPIKCILLANQIILKAIKVLCGIGVTISKMRPLSAFGASRTSLIVECPLDQGDPAHSQAIVRQLS